MIRKPAERLLARERISRQMRRTTTGGESWRMKFALSLRCEGDGMGGKKKERRRKKEGTSGSWSGECFRQTMCATCSRCPGNVREGTGGERPPELLLSQEGLALSGGLVCVWARSSRKRREDKKKSVIPIYTSLLVEELLFFFFFVVVGFKKRNVTLSLVPSTVHNCCVSLSLSFSRHTQTALEPYRLFCCPPVYITGSFPAFFWPRHTRKPITQFSTSLEIDTSSSQHSPKQVDPVRLAAEYHLERNIRNADWLKIEKREEIRRIDFVFCCRVTGCWWLGMKWHVTTVCLLWIFKTRQLIR